MGQASGRLRVKVRAMLPHDLGAGPLRDRHPCNQLDPRGVLGFLGSWSAGTMTAADVFAYGSILWGIAQATYNRFFKRQTA